MFPQVPRWWVTLLVSTTLTPTALLAAPPDVDAGPDGLRWEVVAADCDYLVQTHQRDESGQQGQPSERLQLRSGAGTYIYARHPVAAARMIDDLQIDVWIDANRRGLQVFGQIALPDTLDPETGRRATVLVAGDAYESVGRWQRLQLSGIPQKLERQVRVLRARLRQPIDTRRAYLEAVVVNVFGGPGTTEVQLGELELVGNLPPAAVVGEGIAKIGYTAPSAAPWPPPRRRSGRLTVEGRPFFPRVVEHQGEPFALLRQLGFNTVYLAKPPTTEQHQQARELGLWLIVPPPDAEISAEDDQRILGWFCGEDFTLADLPPDHLDRVRNRDPHRRPLIAGVRRDRWRASRELDVLLHCREPLGTSFELSHFGPWLDQLNQLARPGTPFWSCIQTELAPEVLMQARGLTGLDAPLPGNVEAEQIRQLALASIAAGARGLWFRSLTPLDRSDSTAELRRLMLELINAELALVEPWAIGGQRIGDVPCDNAELRVVALATERSRLLIPTHVQPNAQFSCRPIAGRNALVIAGVSDSTDAFQVSHVGLVPLKKQRISGGLRLELAPESADALLVLTEDPLVVTHIHRVVGQNKRRVAVLTRDLAERRLAELENSAARKLLENNRRVEAWETARQALRFSRNLGEANDLSAAFRFAHQANRELDKLQSDVWREITASAATPLSHPAAATFSLALAAHPPLASSPDETPASRNLLQGGECESLSLMVAAGWRQHQVSPPDVETYIALSPHQPHSGRYSLRMLAAAKTPDADQSVVDFAPVWINSAPVTVQPGERVRISGWIRIDQPIRGSYDGCLISDSVSGPALSLRFRRSDGWERFEMTRAVTRHDHLTVMITLHGLGEVWIDDLHVSVDPPAAPDNNPSPQVSQFRSSLGQ